MRKKLEKPTKTTSPSTNKVSIDQSLLDRLDETYRQINQVSFQQNFKALIGHYKTTDVSLALS